MKRIISVLLVVLLCSLLGSCAPTAPQYRESTFFAMDTVFTLRIYGEEKGVETHFASVRTILTEVEDALSKTRPESDVSRINRERSAGDLSPHTVAVLEVAARVGSLTDGAYLPTMGAVTQLWQEAGEANALPSEEVLALALREARLGFALEGGVCTLLGEGSLLDLGGIGKGYAADCILTYLREAAVQGALLSFGSSVATVGEKGSGEPFTVGLRHPRNGDATVGTLTAPQGVLSVSGDYERYVTVGGVQYHHVLDPQSGYPTNTGVASVAVLCESGAYSDALSTAFMVMGRERAMALLASGRVSAEAIFVSPDGTVYSTTDCFTAN